MKTGPPSSSEVACVFRLIVSIKEHVQLPPMDAVTEDSAIFRDMLHAVRVEGLVYDRARKAANRESERQRGRSAG